MATGAIAHNLEAKPRTDDVRLKELAPFSKMLLSDSVRKGLQQAGFVYPTIIQATAIPVGKSGIDLLVQSKSGTGKTLIFSTIVLEMYRSDIVEPQSLIVAPTREIAVQIETVLNEIGRYCAGFRTVCVIGGLDVSDDRKRLQNAKAIVGTPGRILHLIQNDVLNTSKINLLVLDEADKMYTQSFRQDLQRIQKALPAKRQTIACSATFCDDLDKELAKIMCSPLLISTEDRATLLVGIKQFIYELPEQKTSILEMQSKLDALRDIFGRIPFKQCLIFAGSQSRADSYRNYLEKEGWPCELISGAQDQKTRLAMFHKFREFKTRILVATDLMSRGIDSENANLVINLELPTDVVTYLHRIGRAGRFGSHGIAISFIASEKDRCTYRRLITQVGNGMSVLKFPKNKAEQAAERDFWDFSDVSADCKHYGIFGQEALAPLATQDYASLSNSQENKENQSENICNSSSSIDTKTFQIDSKDSALNMLDLLVDRPEYNLQQPQQELRADSRQSSSQQLPSSNTIDDASSIAADSVQSSQQDISRFQSVLMQKAAIPTLVEFLVDQHTPTVNEEDGGRKKPAIDLFEDYNNAVLNNDEETISTKETEVQSSVPPLSKQILANLKSYLIDAEAEQEAPQRSTDIYSDYANFINKDENTASMSEATAADDIDKATFILSVATPTNAHESLEELRNSSLDVSLVGSATETQSIPEVKHFTSPTYQTNGTIPDVIPPHQGLPNKPANMKRQQKLTVNVGDQIEIPPLNLLEQPGLSPAPSDTESAHSAAESLQSHSSNEEAEESSGFNEGTTSSVSSGIETSESDAEVAEQEEDYDDDESAAASYENDGEDFDYDDNTLEQQEEEYVESDDEESGTDFDDDEDEYIENVDEDDEENASVYADPIGRNIKDTAETEAEENAHSQHGSVNSHTDTNTSYNLAYQNAYTQWVDMYFNQMTCIQDYVKFFKHIKQQQRQLKNN